MATIDPRMTWGAILRAPMLRIALPFVGGITWAMWWPIQVKFIGGLLLAVTIAAVLLLALSTHHAGRWRRGAITMLWCFIFGLFWQIVRDPHTHPLHAAQDGAERVCRVLHITAINGISEKVLRADGVVRGAYVEGRLQRRVGKVMLTLMRTPGSPDPVAGDELVVCSALGPIERIPDPGGFDRRAWAASRGMYHELFAGTDEWSVQGHAWRWTDLFEGTRQKVSTWLADSGLPYRERALVKALVLGLRDELDGEQRDAFVRSGTIHVLAVSGTHVGFIYAMLLFMLGWWGGTARARLVRGVLILVALWCYAGLTGAAPSVLRATFMFSLFTVAGMASRRAEPLNSLFAAAMVLLVWDPHMLVEIGFQLSFLAVLSIILFHGPIERLWIPNNKYVGHFWTLAVMSIAAQLLTTPLSIYLFQAFPVWFLPANLVVVTAAGFAVYGAVGLLAFHKVPLLGPLVAMLLTLLLTIVDRVTGFFASLPGAYPAIRIGAFDMVLLYVLVAFVAMWLIWRWRTGLHIAFVTLSLLMVSWGWQARNVHDRVTFTVFDDRKALQAAITVGRECVVLGADSALQQDQWLGKKIERQMRSMGLTTLSILPREWLHADRSVRAGATLAGGGMWRTTGLQVHFFSAESALHGGTFHEGHDVLVIHDLRFISEDVLAEEASKAKQVVVAGGMGWKTRAFILKWCAEHGKPCHDVRDQGAFVLERGVS